MLIAAALGVSSDVFRDAFSHVRPAPAGTRPSPDQVRKNKESLMNALGPHGVTNDRLDEVSNYYRYVRSRGEMWPTKPAAAYAEVKGGKIVRFVVTKGGSGYSSPPSVSVPGFDVTTKVELSFGKKFETQRLGRGDHAGDRKEGMKHCRITQATCQSVLPRRASGVSPMVLRLRSLTREGSRQVHRSTRQLTLAARLVARRVALRHTIAPTPSAISRTV